MGTDKKKALKCSKLEEAFPAQMLYTQSISRGLFMGNIPDSSPGTPVVSKREQLIKFYIKVYDYSIAGKVFA